MVEKQHAHLLRDIQGYIGILDPNPILDSANFFIPCTYLDAQRQERPCYLITKKGCDMVANKMTGEKGIILVAVKDVQLNSINNLAVVLVHESLHLHVLQKGYIIIPEQEEAWCYRYELDFIDKLPNPEPWLKQHAITQLTNIQK